MGPPLTSLAIITDTDSTTSDAVFAIVIAFTSPIAADNISISETNIYGFAILEPPALIPLARYPLKMPNLKS
jgi:hypothetical protein